MAFWFPPPPVMTGGRQPYEQRKLPPSFENVQVDNPPFTYGGPIALQASIAAIAQASPNNYTPWQYQFFGGPQPYQPRRLILAPARIDAPPPTHAGRTAVTASITAINQPSAWPYQFTGGPQPYAPTRLTPANEVGVRTDSGIYLPRFVEWKPPGRDYQFVGGRQPFAGLQLPAALLATTADANNSAPRLAIEWKSPGKAYLFIGGLQPYGPPRPLDPTFLDIPQPIPGAGKRKRTTPFIPDPPWTAPNKPQTFRPVWDKGADEPGKITPAPVEPPPYPPKSLFARRTSLASLPQDPIGSIAAAKMGLPTFDHLVPPDPQGLTKRMDETRDISDAIAVLRALGLWKD